MLAVTLEPMLGRAPRPPRPAPARAAALVAGALLVGVVAGCNDGSDTAAPSATTGTDPCSLLTVDQIEASTGWAVGTGQRPDDSRQDDRAVCNWEDPQGGGAVQVQLLVDVGESAFERDRATAVADAVAAPDDLVVVGATAAFEMADLGQLTMLVDDDVVQLTVLGTDLDGDEQRQLADDVVASLS